MMDERFAELLARLHAAEADIEAELTRRREALRFEIQNRRIVFEDHVRRLHATMRTHALRYLAGARPLVLLTAPVIYAVIVPMIVLDILVMIYQAVCFPIYGIPKVRRRDYLVFDRHHLAYLNVIEKFNCAYCSYFNQAIAFIREVASRTEVYWCPIKHARRVLGPHPHYAGFADFGDAQAYRERVTEMKDGVTPEMLR